MLIHFIIIVLLSLIFFFYVTTVSSNTEDTRSSRLNPEPWDRESHVPRLYQITPETSEEEKEVPKEEGKAVLSFFFSFSF